MEHESRDLRFSKRFLLAYDDEEMSSSVVGSKAVKTTHSLQTPKSKNTVGEDD